MNNQIETILADCLREKPGSYMVDALLRAFPTIPDLANATAEELKDIKGIGDAKARQLQAILKLVRVLAVPPPNESTVIRSPKDVYQLLYGELRYLQVERFIVIGLNTKNKVVFMETIGSGSLNACIVHPRETFKPVIKRACASCILVHNHPSGDVTPSAEDIALTKKLVEGGRVLDITVLDHVIIAGASYLSFKTEGIL